MRLRFWHARPEEVEAADRAERELEEVRDRWPEVHEAASLIREHARRNGFADMIRAAMGVGK